MKADDRHPLRFENENDVLRAILEGTATDTGERFFESLVQSLSIALGSFSAWVTEFIAETRHLKALAFYVDGELTDTFEIPVDGTPCQAVIDTTELIHYPKNVIDLFPHSDSLKAFRAVSYMGIPLVDNNGKVLGNLAILDRRPIPNEPRAVAIFKIFANRASAELQRMKAERKLKKSEERYRRIIETTGEGFLLLDNRFKIADANEAFCRLVGYSREELIGRSPLDLAADDFRDYLAANWTQPLSYRLADVEGRLAPRQGSTIPVRIYGDILKDDRGDTIGYMYFIIDITHQKRSLALAGEVQKNLLPQNSPRIEGFDIAGSTLSCQEIGGDYFDYLFGDTCPNPHLDIIVGDVTGHGVEAALLMTTARAHLRMQAQRSSCESLADSLAELNRHLVLDVLDTGRFMTLFYLRLNPDTRDLTWARAGHPPAVVYSPATDRFTELSGRGIALGLDPKYLFEENAARGLVDGTVIAIGTDGIWESVNQEKAFYGKERFFEAIRKNADRGAGDILKAIIDDVKRFSLGVVQEDDITLVVIKTVENHPPGGDFEI